MGLSPTHLLVAVSVGGNAELVRGADGGGFLPAIAGYDPDGRLAAGITGLADASAIGSVALALNPEGEDARGNSLALRLSVLVEAAARRLTALAGRLVTAAVAVLPPDSGQASRAALFQAVEAGGLDLLRLVEAEGEPAAAMLEAARLAEAMR